MSSLRARVASSGIAIGVGTLALALHAAAWLGWTVWTKAWPEAMQPFRWALTLVERDASLVLSGQWWRLTTAPLFHVSAVHAGTTAFALSWAFAADRDASVARVGASYLGACVAGGVVVAAGALGLPVGNAVGASTVLAVWIGVQAGSWDVAERDPRALGRAVSVPVAMLALAELAGSADTAGHLAGLGVGSAFGAVASWLVRRGAQGAWRGRVMAWGAALVFAAGAAAAVLHGAACASTAATMRACGATLGG
jgi:membrane associated rhomboid family serine protease